MADAPLRLYRFFGDLNCPFCFVQSERIRRMGLDHLIEWCGVEHTPQLPAYRSDTERERSAIREELERLSPRAPDVDVSDPGFRPNTRLALSVVAQIPDTETAGHVRSAFYRALWHDGRDISDADVVAAVVRPYGLSPDAHDGPAMIARTTKQWVEGPFDRRIPSMLSPDGQTLLGMAAPDALRSFIWLQRPGAEPDQACVAEDAPL